MTTRRQLCELVIRNLAGGDPSDDFPVKPEEVNLWMEHAIAAAAKVNYTEGVNLDGIEFVADAFYTSFRNLELLYDELTDSYYTELPSMPYGLPRGYDISSLQIQGNKQLSKTGVRVNPQQLSYYKELPMPPNMFYFWTEKKRLWCYSFTPLQDSFVYVRMASAADTSGDLDSELALPSDFLPYVTDYLEKKLRPMIALPADITNDGINKP